MFSDIINVAIYWISSFTWGAIIFMNRTKIENEKLVRVEVRRELNLNVEARYHHRLHAILLLSKGLSASEVADLFDEDRRTIQRWKKRFQEKGLDGLHEAERKGRPALLSTKQWERLERDMVRRPFACGYRTPQWDGPLLAKHLGERYGVSLGLRQCQRILREKCSFRRTREA